MIEWPDTDELKRVLNVDSGDDDETLDDVLDRVMAAAIRRVKNDRGKWDEDEDEPNENLAQAALRMAELMSERPDAAPGSTAWRSLSSDPTYQTLLIGERRSFGIG